MTSVVMSPSANKQDLIKRLLVLGNSGSNRIAFLNEALERRGRAGVTLISWRDILNGVSLAESIRPGDAVRIESPGRDAGIEAAFVGIGREAEKGEIFYPRRWYEGFCRTLDTLRCQLAQAPPHRLLNDTEEIAALFDKAETHRRFRDAGLPVPRALGAADSLPALAEKMKEQNVRQAFVKLAHGSSASGAIAVRTDGAGRWRAYTTVEPEGSRFFNSRRIRVLDSPSDIDALLIALAPHNLHIEEWLPKASFQGHGFDVRALVIAGKLCHVVGRLSHTPMTNLHLLNPRASAASIRECVGEPAWRDLTELAERAARVFPNSLHLGLDAMWLPGFRRLAILEANAFGDLLPGALWNGQTTYETELEAIAW